MEESFSLYFQDGSSDKVYHAQLKNAGDNLFKVDIQYGRRGGTPKVDTKTPTPVEYAVAKKAYDKVKKEKMAKGYVETEGGEIYQDVSAEKTFSGVSPQLLNTIKIEDVPYYVQSDEWIMQQKFDGERLLIKKNGENITGINKKGIEIPITKALEAHFLQSKHNFCIDGEIIDGDFHMFDILEYKNKNLRNSKYEERLEVMYGEKIFAPYTIPTAKKSEDKQALFDQIQINELEGVVFKKVDALYIGGRPASNGSYLKFKFLESATLLVKKQNKTKRSVLVVGYDDDSNEYELGNITIPPNKDVPKEGAIIEVSYLYAYKNGDLFQTTYKGERHDQDLSDCKLGQLKYKSENKKLTFA